MRYDVFLKRYDCRLGPDSSGRKFTEHQLATGWAWWSEKSFRDEGLCHDKETGEFYRYTTEVERFSGCDRSKYIIGKILPDAPFWSPKGDKRIEEIRKGEKEKKI